MIIAIPDDYQQLVTGLDCYALLRGHDVRVFQGPARSLDELAAQLLDAEVIVPIRERTHFPRELLTRLPRLRQISQTGRSTHHIDVAACTERGIAVSAGSHASPHTIAEHTWALILSALRDIPGQSARMKRGEWSSHLAVGLHGRTLGIHGLGKIGSLVARTGKSFGMRVLAWGGEASRSRAEVIAPGALAAALRHGRPGYAAVDVYENEPVLGGDHPLLKMDNVLCTPHSAWIEKDMFELYFGEAFDNVLRYARGEKVNLVNAGVLPH